jgi:hypothetical protein
LVLIQLSASTPVAAVMRCASVSAAYTSVKVTSILDTPPASPSRLCAVCKAT